VVEAPKKHKKTAFCDDRGRLQKKALPECPRKVLGGGGIGVRGGRSWAGELEKLHVICRAEKRGRGFFGLQKFGRGWKKKSPGFERSFGKEKGKGGVLIAD